MYNYGLALKILRKRFSLTQSELAEKIGVSNHAVSKWENGVNQPDLTILQEICKIFNITLDQFVRLSSGDSEESVFGDSVKEVSRFEVKNFFNAKTIIIIFSIVILITLTISIVLVAQSCDNGRNMGGESLPSIKDESIDFGEEIEGTKSSFLNEINSALKLKDGINEYDVVGNLKLADKNIKSTSYKLVVDKINGEISRYYVKSSEENIDAYTDFSYIYTEKNGEKVRLDKSSIDLSNYLKDIEEEYLLKDVIYVKGYKKGYVKQYVYSFTEEYVSNEMKELLEELNGSFINNCEGVFVVSSSGFSEKITLDFTYQGKEYQFVASRQLNIKSEFKFPNFSSYIEPEVAVDALNEIEKAIQKTNALDNYLKVLNENGHNLVTIESCNFNNTVKVTKGAYQPIYYVDGNIYDYSSNYDGSFPYFIKCSYNEFYTHATKNVDLISLLNLNFNIYDNYVDTVLRNEYDDGIEYKFYLNSEGVENLASEIDEYLYPYGIVTVTYSICDEVISCVEISDNDDNVYKLEIRSSNDIILPDFSSYGALCDGKNVITNVKYSKGNEYELNYEVIVDGKTGDVFTLDVDSLKWYDKNHNLVKQYELDTAVNNWKVGKLLGKTNCYIYYSLFDGYYCDFSEVNQVWEINLNTGECQFLHRNYSYTKIPVAMVNGRIYYENYNIGLEIGSDFNRLYFDYFDSTNNLIVAHAYKDDKSYRCVYNANNNTLSSQETEFSVLNDDYICGEGYYGVEDGVYYLYSNIGKTIKPTFMKVVDRHPDRYYESEIGANWQIVKETTKYTFTIYGVYEKETGNFIYFPKKAEYRFFNGGVHVWDFDVDVLALEKNWYTFYF